MLKKVVFHLIYTIAYLTLCLGMMGCGNKEIKAQSTEQEKIGETNQIEADLESEKYDYSQYLEKIWVSQIQCEDSDFAPLECSFYFTVIEDGKVEGRLCTDQGSFVSYNIKTPNNDMEPLPYIGEFSGEVVGDSAECKFDDGRGFGGQILLHFVDEQNIEVTFMLHEEQSYRNYFWGANYDGTYTFNPWNISDEEFCVDEKLLVDGNLKYGEGVFNLILGEKEYGRMNYPCAYLHDEKGNVVYGFDIGYIPESKISDTVIKDVDRDGLEDITIMLSINGIKEISYIFYQQEDFSWQRERVDLVNQDQTMDFETTLEKCKDRIWLAGAGQDNIGAFSTDFSFYISDIDNGRVTGRFSMGFLQKDCFEKNQGGCREINLGVGYFQGEIVDGKVECWFQDEQGNSGRMSIANPQEDQIEAEVIWLNRDYIHDKYSEDCEDGNYSFVACNINDLYIANNTKRDINEELSATINWKGKPDIWFVCGKATNIERGTYGPEAYLLTPEGEILYDFFVPCATNMEIIDANVEDVDGNGLEDIRMVVGFVDDTYDITDTRIFYQQEDGLFCYEYVEENEHNYATWLDFPHDAMELADEELYSYLAESYSEIDWYGVFDKGDMDKYETYKNVFKELILQERTFINMETGEEMLLGDHDAILLPDGMDATYDMEHYDYYFFDADGDGTQELTILGNETGMFFKYMEDEDQIVLCEEIKSGFYQLGGTGILLFSDGTTNYFYQWNEDGEIECIVHFFTRSYDGELVYCISLPEYTEAKQKVYIPDKMKEIGYLDESDNKYYVRVTEDEYNMLTGDFFGSYKQGEETIKELTYTYEEFLGSGE